MAYGTIKADIVLDSNGNQLDITAVTTDNATTSAAGYMSAADKTKLDGIETGATADQTAADLGLGNVDNTADADKPISTATQTALDAKADLVGGVVPNSQLPSLAITEYLGTAANQTAMLAFSGQRGDWAIRTDTGSTWVITTDGGSNLSDWTELATPADAVSSVNGYTGTVVLSGSDVGLSSTDNLTEGSTNLYSQWSETGSDIYYTSGNAGIGTASPVAKTHISKSYSAPTGGHDSNLALVVSNSGSAGNYTGIGIAAGNNAGSFIHFGDADDDNVGALNYFHHDNSLTFVTAASERMRLDASGRLLVGTSTGSSYTDRLLTVGNTSHASPTIEIRSSTTGFAGLVFSDSTAADNSSYRGTLEYDHANDSMQFRTAGNIVSVIDSSGNAILKSSTSNQQPALRVESFGEYGQIKSDGTGALILDADPDFNAANSTIKFNVDGSERMKIDSSGNVVVTGDRIEVGTDPLDSSNSGIRLNKSGSVNVNRSDDTTFNVFQGSYDGSATSTIAANGSATFAAGKVYIDWGGGFYIGADGNLDQAPYTTRKISLNADGSAEFEGVVTVSSDGTNACTVHNNGYFSSNRSAGSSVAFSGNLNGSSTSEIKADGSAEFANNNVSILSTGEVWSGTPDGTATATDYGAGLFPAGAVGCIVDPSSTAEAFFVRHRTPGGLWSDAVAEIKADGSASFTGLTEWNNGGLRCRMNPNGTSNGGELNLLNSSYSTRISLFGHDGSAYFAGEVKVGSTDIDSATEKGSLVGPGTLQANQDNGANRVFAGKNSGTITSEIFANGSATFAGNVTAFSDIKLKENIEVIPDALEKVSQIRGVTYDRKDVEVPRQAGVIAQEVEAVLPEVVTTDGEGVKSVAYGNLVGLLIEAVKELQERVETLEAERN